MSKKIIRKCPICNCPEYEGVDFKSGIVFCTYCGTVYKQVIFHPTNETDYKNSVTVK